MLTIGCHLSKRRGYLEMAERGGVHQREHLPVLHPQPPRQRAWRPSTRRTSPPTSPSPKEHGIHDALAYAPYDVPTRLQTR